MKSQESTVQSGERAIRQFSTFRVQNLFFGLEVLQVQEVLRYQEMTKVPLAPDLIEGLINLRGQIVTAIDMRRRLNLEPRTATEPPMNMVVRSEDGAVSLLVDEIGDVLEVRTDSYEPPPENTPSDLRNLIAGVYKLDDQLLLVLDKDKVLQVQSLN